MLFRINIFSTLISLSATLWIQKLFHTHTHTKKDHRLKAYCLDEPKKHQANS